MDNEISKKLEAFDEEEDHDNFFEVYDKENKKEYVKIFREGRKLYFLESEGWHNITFKDEDSADKVLEAYTESTNLKEYE